VIGGDFDLSAAEMTAAADSGVDREATGPSGDAEFDPVAVIVLDRAEVRGNVELYDTFRARGTLRASSAEIGGDLRFDRAGIGVPAAGAYAVVADGVVVRGQVTGAEAEVHGEICLQDARIQHNVQFQRAVLHAPGANAVNLSRATIGGTIDCGQIRAEGSLRLADVTAGSVFVSGAVLDAPCVTDQMIYQVGAREIPYDPLLNLIGSQIIGTVRGNPAGRPFRARGSIALRGARVSRSVQFIEAEIVSDHGPALDASTLACSDLYLAGLDAVGEVRFTDARIAGDLDLTRAHLRWDKTSIEELAAGKRPAPAIDGGAATRRTLDGELSVKVPLVGGQAEQRLAPGIRQRIDDEAVALIKTRTRQLAKRQLTWFRREPQLNWLEIGREELPSITVERILQGMQHREENSVS